MGASSLPTSSAICFLASMAIVLLMTTRTDAREKDDGRRELSHEENWIESSIKTTMLPADRMGITVNALNLSIQDKDTNLNSRTSQGSLSLSMPLEGNTNVHGSAFAGSLYSLSVLCAWYILVTYLRALRLAEQYTVVIKSAEISYLRPVINVDRVLATSVLPDQGVCRAFLTALQEKGKTTLNITGSINVQTSNPRISPSTAIGSTKEKKAVEYTAALCAFIPRSSTSTGNRPKKYCR